MFLKRGAKNQVNNKKQFIYLALDNDNDNLKYCKFVLRHKEMINFINPEITINKISKLFKNKFGSLPKIVEGPYIEYKGLNIQNISNGFYYSVKVKDCKIELNKISDILDKNDGLIFGPFSPITAENKSKESKINRDLSDIILSARQQEAEFNGWSGIANFIENDLENILFIFIGQKDNRSIRSKNVPHPGKIKLSNVKLL